MQQKHQMIPRGLIVADPNNPKSRSQRDPQLAKDIEARGLLIFPMVRAVNGKYVIIDGHLRFASLPPEMTEVPCQVIVGEVSPQLVIELQIATDFHKLEHSAWDRYLFLEKLAASYSNAELAEKLHIDPSVVSRYLSIGRAIPAAQEALKDGRINLSAINLIAQQNSMDQARFLEMALAGVTKEEITKAIREKKNGQETVKLAKVKIALPGKESLVLSGRERGMAGVCETLAEVLKMARKAESSGYDIATWVSMMKDQAKGV